MGTSWKGVRVLCPFYISEDARSITCEGMVPRATLRQKYRTERDCDTVKVEYCEKDYKHCPVYHMLMKYKYRENT